MARGGSQMAAEIKRIDIGLSGGQVLPLRTTVDPYVAVVPVPDPRLARVGEVVGASPVVPETIAFHDIAGLARGAHRGEGLGNRFLANIRETDAILLLTRAFED